MTKELFFVSLTILVAVVTDNVLKLLVRVPKHFDTRRAQTYAAIIRNIITFAVYVAAVYAVFIELNINLTPLLASAGIAGVIIGLGAKTLIEDFIAGLFLLSQESIAIGDHVKIDDAEGTIEHISPRTLIVRSGTGALFIIPNGQIKRVTNFSRHRTKYTIEITLKADQSIDTILKTADNALKGVLEDKELSELLLPGSAVDGIDDFKSEGYMTLKVTFVTRYENRFAPARKFRYLLKKEFEKNKLHFG